MPTTTETAPAKINLALHVRHRRADGYHELETLFAFAEHGDVVTVRTADADSFAIIGPFAAALRPAAAGTDAAPWDGNLVTAAADAFVATFGIAAHHAITLDKRLPIASGIGGGSADAAATLRALARLHGVAVQDPALHDIAARLGADVPACLVNRTTFGTGRGDTLVAVDGLAGTPLLCVNPGVAVSTAAVFGAWDGIDRGPLGAGPLLERAIAGRNDLEAPAWAIAPEIARVSALLDAAPGVLLSRMSGSGATCFALFDSIAARDSAATDAGAQGWWTLACTLR